MSNILIYGICSKIRVQRVLWKRLQNSIGRLISVSDFVVVGSSFCVGGKVPAGVSVSKFVCLHTVSTTSRKVSVGSHSPWNGVVLQGTDSTIPICTRSWLLSASFLSSLRLLCLQSKRNTEVCAQPERRCKLQPRKNQHKLHMLSSLLIIPFEIIGGLNRKANTVHT